MSDVDLDAIQDRNEKGHGPWRESWQPVGEIEQAFSDRQDLLTLLADREREIAELRAEIREWLCETCNTVYPGPPQEGFKCVICPNCGGFCASKVTVERTHRRRLRAAAQAVVDAERADNLAAAQNAIVALAAALEDRDA